MRIILTSILVVTFLSSCLKTENKKAYSGYVGQYDCEIYEYERINSDIWDSTYYGTFNLTEIDGSTMMFLGMEIPYKYIDENGLYQNSSLNEGSYSGRQITFRNDSIIYVEYHSTGNTAYEKKFSGVKN